MRLCTAIPLFSCFLFAAQHASADTLVVTQTETGSGVFYPVAGQPINFSNLSIVRTYSGDASGTYSNSTESTNFNGTETVAYGRFGTAILASAPPDPYLYGSRPYGFYAFIDGSRAGIASYTQSADGQGALQFTTGNPIFAQYDLTDSFGPVIGTFSYLSGGFFPNEPDIDILDGGRIEIDSFGPTSTFQTSIVSTTPEPSTLVLLGTGLLGTVGIARRRYSSTERSLARRQGYASRDSYVTQAVKE